MARDIAQDLKFLDMIIASYANYLMLTKDRTRIINSPAGGLMATQPGPSYRNLNTLRRAR